MLRILLAEDNPGDILLVQEALKEHGIPHELQVVQDGAQALELITRIGGRGNVPCPDLVLLDINLPKKDGQQVLSELRRHPDCSQVSVIVVTSSDAARDRTRMAELRIDRYFKKPSDFDAFLQLGALVREVVEGKAA